MMAGAEQPAQRMLAALTIRGSRAWFFKAIGPVDVIGGQTDAFQALLKSLRFDGDNPAWDLPEGWRQRPASGMRFATLEFGPADAPQELTVIPLEVSAGGEADYILANVNRWRQQMQLDQIEAGQLNTETQQIKAGDITVTFVDLQSRGAATGAGGAERQ